jgi:alpha 1,6-mannosyltransferase
MLRYTLLYLIGGVYSDTDTSLLKPISDWGGEPDLYRQGRGWLFPEDQADEPTEVELDVLKRELNRASVIVGVESDVGERKDWHDWWPRPVSLSEVPSGLAHVITEPTFLLP